MDTYRICVFRHSDTYYNCVKCHKVVPNCSTPVDESHTGYGEDHLKAVSICKLCSGSKKRQSSISTFFQPRFIFSFITQCKNTHIQVLVESVYVRIWPAYVGIST